MERPKWVDYMLPILNILSDGKEHKRRETIEAAADSMDLGEDLQSGKIGSGERIYHNRCGWALTYLKQSGLISFLERAMFVLTEAGKDFLSKKPQKMAKEDLKPYVGYKEFMGRAKEKQNADSGSEEKDLSS